MIVPRETPKITGLNSYFLELDRLVAHMQREIGSGSIYCRSIAQEIMIHFSPVEVVNCLCQDGRQPLRRPLALGAAIEALGRRNFQVSVHYLDLNAVYFWSQIPPFIRQDDVFITRSRFFQDLIEGYSEARFSGFLDLSAGDAGGVVFFDQGRMIGGSYSWGRGGLSPWEDDFNKLVALAGSGKNLLQSARFTEGGPAMCRGLNTPPWGKRGHLWVGTMRSKDFS
ncbi:MAG: hypothetical protein ABIL58_07635 [Pseudomonadota bacterium]